MKHAVLYSIYGVFNFLFLYLSFYVVSFEVAVLCGFALIITEIAMLKKYLYDDNKKPE